MEISSMVILVVSFAALALATDALGRRLHLPQALLLVLAGAAAGPGLGILAGTEPGLDAMGFHDLVFFLFLPLLVFDAAFRISIAALVRDLGLILVLAVAGVLLTAMICALIIYLAIGGGTDFPWIAALLAGAVLAATDPVAVIAQLDALRAPQRLRMLLEGESLFNDASTIVLFGVLLGIATRRHADPGLGGAILGFLVEFAGALGFGAIAGLVGARALRALPQGVAHALLALLLAYGTYLIAEIALGVSGIVATLVAGLLLARAVQREDSSLVGRELGFTLRTLAYGANGCLFLLVGLLLELRMFADHWRGMLLAALAVLLARVLVVYACLGFRNRCWRADPVPRQYRGVLIWGGLRGAVTLALALALPGALDYGPRVQAMAFGVVLFTLFVQAPTVPWLIRGSGLR